MAAVGVSKPRKGPMAAYDPLLLASTWPQMGQIFARTARFLVGSLVKGSHSSLPGWLRRS